MTQHLKWLRLWLFALISTSVFCACSSSNFAGNDASTDGGEGVGIGLSASVPQACQTCLAQSSSNDCSSKQKNCIHDTACVALNTCINNCAIEQSCVTNCSNTASANTIDEWNSWYLCTCADCTNSCASTFCGPTSTDSDAASNPDAGPGTCVSDNYPCSNDGECCSQLCASDGNCGCISPNVYGCLTDRDCCSGFCDLTSNICQ